ncbi:MAG: TPM domain-containing protein, partial [Clostridiales bacterium]|nr:TPM domain-containing protein [Clostridiales bacterium]
MKKLKRLMSGIIFSLCFFVCFAVNTYAAPEPTELYYANDYAGVLSEDTIRYIVDANYGLFDRTGAQVVVSVVDFTDGESMEDYSLDMFNSWGIGSEKNNGLLLLLSIGDDNYWVQTGADLSKKLSMGEVSGILNDKLEPYFAEKEYDTGVRAVFDEFVGRIETLYADTSNASVSSTGGSNAPNAYNLETRVYNSRAVGSLIPGIFGGFWSIARVLVVAVVVIIVLAIIFGGSRRRRYYGPGPRPRGGGFFWG